LRDIILWKRKQYDSMYALFSGTAHQAIFMGCGHSLEFNPKLLWSAEISDRELNAVAE
jgi:hypothetical protein